MRVIDWLDGLDIQARRELGAACRKTAWYLVDTIRDRPHKLTIGDCLAIIEFAGDQLQMSDILDHYHETRNKH